MAKTLRKRIGPDPSDLPMFYGYEDGQQVESFGEDEQAAYAWLGPVQAPGSTPSVPDFSVADHGSVAIITPLTDAARGWVEENVHLEDWQMWGGQGGFAVDHRPAFDLVNGIVEAGFRVREV